MTTHTVYYGRSVQEEAEDDLLRLLTEDHTSPVYNNYGYMIRREEWCPGTKQRAQELLDSWEGTPKQCDEVNMMMVTMKYALIARVSGRRR